MGIGCGGFFPSGTSSCGPLMAEERLDILVTVGLLFCALRDNPIGTFLPVAGPVWFASDS